MQWCSMRRRTGSTRSNSATRILSCTKTHFEPSGSIQIRQRWLACSRRPTVWSEDMSASEEINPRSNSFPNTAPIVSKSIVSSGSNSIRRERSPAAWLDDCRSANASGSMCQPFGPGSKASDSTMPRSMADAMKGLPPESRHTASTASSGKGPAIDSNSSLTSPASNGSSRISSAGVVLRIRLSDGTSSERNANINKTREPPSREPF